MKNIMINEKLLKEISFYIKEPKWLLEKRLNSFYEFKKLKFNNKFEKKILDINLKKLLYFFEEDNKIRLNKFLKKINIKKKSGFSLNFENKMVFNNIKKEIKKNGLIFMDIKLAILKFENLFKKFFLKLSSLNKNKILSFNSAFWNGGIFIYVPKNINIELPLKSFFDISYNKIAQINKILIILDENSKLNFIEECLNSNCKYIKSLHITSIEIFMYKNSYFNYTAIQKWTDNIYNYVFKFIKLYEKSFINLNEINIGSKITYKFPIIYLDGSYSKSNFFSNSIINKKDKKKYIFKMKIFHNNLNTHSNINSKFIIKNNDSIIDYCNENFFNKNSDNFVSHINCEALLLSKKIHFNTYPINFLNNCNGILEYESKISKLSEKKIFYIMNRGFSEIDSINIIILGFSNLFFKNKKI